MRNVNLFLIETILPGFEDSFAGVLFLFIEADHVIDVDLLVEAVHDAHLGRVHATVLVGTVTMVVVIIVASHPDVVCRTST